MTTAVAEVADNDPRRAAEILGELASDLIAVDGDLPALLERFLEPLLRMSGAQAGAVRAISDLGDQMRLIGSLGIPTKDPRRTASPPAASAPSAPPPTARNP